MKKILALIFLALSFTFEARAQQLKPQVTDAAKLVVDAFDQNLKGWTRERVGSMDGSPGVLVEFWRTVDRTVKVSIVLDPVGDPWVEAKRRRGEPVDGLDHARIDGYCNNTVSFYRGRLGIFIWTETHTNLLSMSEKQNETLSCSEDAATSKLIACFVDLALDGRLQQGKPVPRDLFKSPCVMDLLLKRMLGERIQQQLMHR